MLHVLLLILKILGILLLVILGIVLSIILLVLFVPVRYRADLEYKDNLQGSVFVSWLLRFVTFRMNFDQEGRTTRIGIMGFRLGQKNSDETTEEDASDENSADLVFPEMEIDELEDPILADDANLETAEREYSSKKREQAVQSQELHHQTTEKESEIPTPKQIKSEKKKQKLFLETLYEKVRKISEKVNEIRKKAEKTKNFLSDPENQHTMRLLCKELCRLIRHILPRRLRGHVRFGFDDPYTTGQVLTYISPFYGMYGKQIDVEPVFDEKIVEGNLSVKGHIRVATVIWIVLCVFRDKNFRRLLKIMRDRK